MAGNTPVNMTTSFSFLSVEACPLLLTSGLSTNAICYSLFERSLMHRKIYLDLPTTDDGKLTLYCKFHSLCPELALVNYRGLSFHIYLFWKFSVSIKIDGKSLPASGMNINRCFDYPLDSSNHSHRCSPRSTGE